MTLDEIRADFAVMDDWEDRYRYVIELGRALPPLDAALKTEATKVRGCAFLVRRHPEGLGHRRELRRRTRAPTTTVSGSGSRRG